MNKIIRFAYGVFCSALFSFVAIFGCIEKPIVVIIPSYNNEKWVENNLNSVFKQNYENYRVMYIDDCSNDKTLARVMDLIERYDMQDRVTVIHNEIRCGAMANWYTSIHSCNDNEIVVQLDGDDWLAHDNVLAYLNTIYTRRDIWLTYGQFMEYPSGAIGYEYSKPFSEEVILNNTFRKVGQLPMSHLRTFYAWLFKSIKLEDVLYDGIFYQMTCDKVIMACCIEMAARHHYCVPEVLYVYNNSNQLSDHRVNRKLQHSLAWYILSQPAYKQLEVPNKIDEFDQCDHASLILFCRSKPELQGIESIAKHIEPLHEIFVLFPDEQKACEYKSDSHIIFISYKSSDFINHFRDCIQKTQSHYLILGTDLTFENDVDTTICIQLLRKTDVDILYGIGDDKKELLLLINQQKIPSVSLEYPAYAFYPKNINFTQNLPVIDGALWRKEALLDLKDLNFVKSVTELRAVLNGYIVQQNKLGLLLDLTIAE